MSTLVYITNKKFFLNAKNKSCNNTNKLKLIIKSINTSNKFLFCLFSVLISKCLILKNNNFIFEVKHYQM